MKHSVLFILLICFSPFAGTIFAKGPGHKSHMSEGALDLSRFLATSGEGKLSAAAPANGTMGTEKNHKGHVLATPPSTARGAAVGTSGNKLDSALLAAALATLAKENESVPATNLATTPSAAPPLRALELQASAAATLPASAPPKAASVAAAAVAESDK